MGKHLVIVADDLGLEGYSRTVPEANIDPNLAPATPFLDALADDGVRFRRAYVNPRCSPSRSLLFTGRYAFRTGMGNNAVAVNTVPGAAESWLPVALDATHTTANIGKWHLYNANNGNLLSPLKSGSGGVAGLDRWQGVYANIFGGETYWNWSRFRDGVLYDLATAALPIGDADGPANRVATNYATTINIDDAISWIGAQGGDWLCVVAMNAPHSPLHIPPTLAERVSGGYGSTRLMSEKMEDVTAAYVNILSSIDVPTNQAVLDGYGWPSAVDTASQWASYAAHIAMCEAADTEIGRLLADANVDISTNADVTVWYVSDNGASSTIVGSMGKNTVYDLGTRVPMIVAGNGVTATAGSTCDRLVDLVDIWRTILDLESIDPATAFPGVTVDGVSIAALLADADATGPRTYSYTELFATPSAANPDGGLAAGALLNGATNDSAYPLIDTWDRAIHSEEYSLLEFNTYDSAGTRTVTYELYNYLGGDQLNGSQLLLSDRLGFNSVSRNTTPWRALQALVAQLEALAP